MPWSFRRPRDFRPYGLAVRSRVMAELVGERADDGQAPAVLGFVVGAGRVPLAGPGVGDLDSRPPGSRANRDRELAVVDPGWSVADGVADQFGGDELGVVIAGRSFEDSAHEPPGGWHDGGNAGERDGGIHP